MPRRTIVFLLPDLSGGGAERVCLEFVRNIDRKDFEPVLVLGRESGALMSQVPSDVPVYSLKKTRPLDFPRLVVRFSGLCKRLKPDLVFSALWYADLIQLVGDVGEAKRVCSIHTVPDGIRSERFGALKIRLLAIAYQRADAVLAVSEGVAARFRQRFSVRADRVRVQHNPFSLATMHSLAAEFLPERSTDCVEILAVGRLSHEKRFDRLLSAVASMKTSTHWTVRILGEGPLREKLERMAERLGIAGKVRFEGFVSNPYVYIRNADILVVSSEVEAFPSVIVEALALGTAVVSFDCPSGPRDLLGGGAGVLVADGRVDDLARSIAELVDSPEARNCLAANGPCNVAHLEATAVTRGLETQLRDIMS